MSKIIDELKKEYKETKKSSILIYFILRFLVILCLIRQIILGNFDSALLCILSLFLLLLPIIIQRRFKIVLPNTLEAIIYIFIFAAEILGEIYNFYGNIPNWDLILHTTNGFLCAAIGLSLIDLLNHNSKKMNLSPLYVAIASFCFSMTIGVCWEFIEYTGDKVLLLDSQKDTIITTISTVELNPNKQNKTVILKDINKTVLYDSNNQEIATINGGYLDIGLNDTMEDLFVNFIGDTVYSILGYFYIKNRDKYQLASKFIITKEN